MMLFTKQKLSWAKRIGILLILISVIILIVGVILTVEIVKDEIKNPKAGQTGLEVALFLGAVILIASLPLVAGLFLTCNKEEKIEMRPNNPLICQYCKLDYDRTWKVCLKCGKQLVEK